VCWSCPKDDLTDWRYEGVIFRKKQDPSNPKGFLNVLYAPDCIQGKDGRYYLYYFIAYKGFIAVAVCDKPAGKYEYLGRVKYADGSAIGSKGEPLQFDPGIFIDDDGRIYLYTGFGPQNYPAILMGGHKATHKGAMCYELSDDMMTVKGDFSYIGVPSKVSGKGTPYEGHEFFEASSMRKFDGNYYFIYSSALNHELCYAVSSRPDGGFSYGGTLISIGDVGIESEAKNYTGNTHGSVLRLENEYYIFYHRQTNRNSFSRQACAEKLRFENGRFIQSELTSCGLNGGPLAAIGTYPAYCACQLYSKKGTKFYGGVKVPKSIHPYFTQTGKDRERDPDQHIANFCDGVTAVFKYFDFDSSKPSKISVSVMGSGEGTLSVSVDKEKLAAQIKITGCTDYKSFEADFDTVSGVKPLIFCFSGTGNFRFMSFTLR
jgi:hypothetical protein